MCLSEDKVPCILGLMGENKLQYLKNLVLMNGSGKHTEEA